MRLILATSNADKIKEIREIYSPLCKALHLEILAWDRLIMPFEIVENGESFKENALIKSKAVFNALKGVLRHSDIVLSDDSGICVEALGGKPGIHSARYSGGNATDNLNLLCAEVAKLPSKTSKAHYCACIGISSAQGDFSAHGFMYGSVISTPKGKNGFGYDPMFIPKGFNKTLAELSSEEKNAISHRTQALMRASYILRTLKT
ncbi:RdgB/HAM1 family non-canonical purine NTP pyrophosphatase [Helicobacter sp.]|uniref:RdgB/HAM1 family non-canonical purine NTP pyrophosphatase n=1 Tax=Helicobacter sp. TaxID=218 RepID=UPI0025BDEF91|nr:RdgB/HAM1 family non-canonical purine NTP pyrophosphatase [Helicobacter sp.]MCI5968283.1 RdgB/HAM1 family non-canonical purine NTP pyrophosphatase [Helicobacter sp.]MDY2585375.1 RdgB/HAM1 family non-canonical purine NTP pyrophosphatase [Helicobacter sp.]